MTRAIGCWMTWPTGNAAFSHVLAGCYAGIGTIGDSHNLISKEFGPRMRVVSVITDAPVPEDEMLSQNLCIHCGQCRKRCPIQCFTENGDDMRAYRREKPVTQKGILHCQNYNICFQLIFYLCL